MPRFYHFLYHPFNFLPLGQNNKMGGRKYYYIAETGTHQVKKHNMNINNFIMGHNYRENMPPSPILYHQVDVPYAGYASDTVYTVHDYNSGNVCLKIKLVKSI